MDRYLEAMKHMSMVTVAILEAIVSSSSKLFLHSVNYVDPNSQRTSEAEPENIFL